MPTDGAPRTDSPDAEPLVPEHAAAAAPSSANADPEARVGDFVVEELVAFGGTGTVYLARHVERGDVVALKLMAPGTASATARRRLDVDPEALARLQHPHIGRIHQVGLHEGEPYFVTEYVPGAQPITRYAEIAGLGTEERLALVAQACRAVHHGHQKGILHRTLKPSHILVDATGAPKVTDFGVAQVTDSDLAVATGGTSLAAAQAYLSPEQRRGARDEIDTRTDVYALGAVLVELLDGRPPFDARSDPAGSLRGDVAMVARAALAQEPDERYQSALEFAQDLERVIERRPIAAKPSSLAEELRKLARRHPLLAGGAGALVIAFVVATGWLVLALQERATARLAATESARQRDTAQGVNDYLVEMLTQVEPETDGGGVTVDEVLAWASPEDFKETPLIEAQLRDTIGNVHLALDDLDAAEREITKALEIRRREVGATHPETLRSMDSLVHVYIERQERHAEAVALGQETVEMRERILGPDHPETVQSITTLGRAYRRGGKLANARQQFERALAIRRRTHDLEAAERLSAMVDLAVVLHDLARYDDAASLLEQVLATRQQARGEEHRDTLRTSVQLIGVYEKQGRFAEAEPLATRALEILRDVLGNEHRETLAAMNTLAIVYRRLGRDVEAEPLLRAAYETRVRVFGEDHPSTLASMNNLGNLYFDQWRNEEAREYIEKTLDRRRQTLGAEDPRTLSSSNNLAILYRRLGQDEKAAELYGDTLEMQRLVLGADHPDTLRTTINLALLNKDAGRSEQARTMLAAAVAKQRQVLGDEHADTLRTINELAILLHDLERNDEAEPLFAETLAVRRRVLGDDHAETIVSMNNLAEVRHATGRHEQALALYAEALSRGRRTLPPWMIGYIKGGRGAVLAAVAQYDEAERSLLDAYETVVNAFDDPTDRRAIDQAERLVALYEAWERPDEAAKWRARLEKAGGSDGE